MSKQPSERKPQAQAKPIRLAALRRKFQELSDPERAAGSLRFFKTGPGEYGEGDRFLGLTVPITRKLVAEFHDLSEVEMLELLRSEWHEERLFALLLMVRWFEKAKPRSELRDRLVNLYLENTRWINNWDLVDTSAPQIVGAWLLDRDRSLLRQLAASKSLWEQRIAVLATFTMIRANDFRDILWLSEQFLSHKHDLMHKACGWMLREAGKRNVGVLKSFLDQHAPRMPRTMLRYAIEKLSKPDRDHYLQRPVKSV